MKKTWKATILTLVIVLAMSFLLTGCAIPFFNNLFNKRTYSLTNCLTENITSDMNVYDIAKSYRDGNATVAVTVEGYNKTQKQTQSWHGSGVCVASNGYKTSLSNGYQASKGSYIVTNYHVIDLFDSNEFTDCEINILTEDEIFYSADLLWYNKDLDVAVIYSDEVNLNYVLMKDRLVDCSRDDRLDYEQIFTIGTPLDLDYINRLTVGNVASNNPMMFYTSEKIYPYTTLNGQVQFTNYPSSYNSRTPYTVLSNLYEDVVDIALGITPGNSGGGCFDANGYLVGLVALGGDVDTTNGNPINGMVSIYPIMKVIDKLIDNNENNGKNKIYTFESLDIRGLDANEAWYARYLKEETNYGNYYLDGNLYSPLNYMKAFSFDQEGYYILTTSSKIALDKDAYITSCRINFGENVDIIDRNDLIYLLLKVNEGDKVTFTCVNSLGVASDKEIYF